MADTAVDAFDPRYEFDAPQFYDFEARSTGSVGSEWFAEQENAAGEEETRAGPSGRTPLHDVNKEANSTVPSGAVPAGDKPARKKNIVTSWGTDGEKKRKAKEGASEQPVAKVTKQKGDAQAAAGAPKTRSQHAAAAEGGSRAKKTAKELKPIKVALKSKTKAKAGQLAGKPTKLSKVLQPRRVMPTRSVKQLTIPQDVELHTSKRAHAHGPKSVGDAAAKQAEHNNPEDHQQQRMRAGVGQGETEDAPAASPYKPLVLRVKEFDKTPGRFKRDPEPVAPAKPLSVTKPKEPKLITTGRTRPSTFKPREVVEEEEMAQMPVFKASTLNPLILSHSGLIGVPKVEKREVTEPQPFHFVSDDRAEARATRQRAAAGAGPSGQQPEADAGKGDKAEKDLPKKARKSVACNPAEPVVPKSPMLLTKLRARETKVEEPRHEFHARPVPKFISAPSMELNASHGSAAAPTQPEPFRLATEQRGAHHRSTLAAKLAAEEEAASRARVPRANGLPLSTDMPLVPPRPEPRQLTIPEPFNLTSEARHEQYMEQKRKALQEEEEAKRAEAEFKARPMWRGIPFRVHDSETVLTVPEEVPLRTSSRAAEREVFNKTMEEKLKEQELAAQLAAQEARMREEEERRQLRKATVFHARPMPDLSAPPAAKPPPAKPLTKPVSPRLRTAKRRAAEK